MKKQHLLYLSAFLALFTFLGHSIGVISNRALTDPSVAATYELMKQTTATFPMGFTRDIATLMTGSNLCLSVYLLVAGLMCLVFARKPSWSSHDNLLVLINSGGLFLAGIVSGFCFFPVPAVCLIAAALAGAASVTAKS